jgi:hypothetical protein
MMRRIGPLSVVGLVLVLAACGGSPSTSSSAPPAGTPAAAPPATSAQLPRAPVAKPDEGIRVPAAPEVHYDAKGRRDPFEVPGAREGSAGTTVASAKLAGIIRTASGSALALIETPEGLGYVLRRGDTLGDGQLVEIDQNSVVFAIATRSGPTPNRVVLKLLGD